MLRRIFGRACLLPREVQTLRGIIRKVQRTYESEAEQDDYANEYDD
jgi:tRNA C32,U32 (ribose-2'-O)-methylase TrmJ